MSELKPCPCGTTPTEIHALQGDSSKWGWATGNCCSEWHIEFRTNYEQDVTELTKLATEAWNEAPRSTGKEIEQLRADHANAFAGWTKDSFALSEMRADLRHYGQHTPACSAVKGVVIATNEITHTGVCSCGFKEKSA